jgi:hypothetical protein
MKKILIPGFIFLMLFAGCSASIPCNDLASVSQEATLYLCNFFSTPFPLPSKSLSPSDNEALIANLEKVNALLDSQIQLASLQSSWYAEQGNYKKAQSLSASIIAIAGQRDSIATLLKVKREKSTL